MRLTQIHKAISSPLVFVKLLKLADRPAAEKRQDMEALISHLETRRQEAAASAALYSRLIKAFTQDLEEL